MCGRLTSGAIPINEPSGRPCQLEFLEFFKEFITALRKIDRLSMLPCQNGMVHNVEALKQLYEYITKEDDSITYICTRYINQDDVEHLFGIIRMRGHGASKPTRSKFMNRIKGLLLGLCQ